MLASRPACSLNQIPADLGIPSDSTKSGKTLAQLPDVPTAKEGGLDFARNLADTREFAGVCFSPDGETLFVKVLAKDRTA